jgi:hypothetical protein
MFTSSSRYYHLETASFTTTDGREIVYTRRRFLPDPSTMQTLAEIVVTQGDRLDLLAARTIGDPEHFWRICDANNVMNPVALTEEIGRRVRIPMPQFDNP